MKTKSQHKRRPPSDPEDQIWLEVFLGSNIFLSATPLLSSFVLMKTKGFWPSFLLTISACLNTLHAFNGLLCAFSETPSSKRRENLVTWWAKYFGVTLLSSHISMHFEEDYLGPVQLTLTVFTALCGLFSPHFRSVTLGLFIYFESALVINAINLKHYNMARVYGSVLIFMSIILTNYLKFRFKRFTYKHFDYYCMTIALSLLSLPLQT